MIHFLKYVLRNTPWYCNQLFQPAPLQHGENNAAAQRNEAAPPQRPIVIDAGAQPIEDNLRLGVVDGLQIAQQVIMLICPYILAF